jgi:hypothetical protein
MPPPLRNSVFEGFRVNGLRKKKTTLGWVANGGRRHLNGRGSRSPAPRVLFIYLGFRVLNLFLGFRVLNLFIGFRVLNLFLGLLIYFKDL